MCARLFDREFSCPSCGAAAALWLPDPDPERADATLKCVSCGTLMRLPKDKVSAPARPAGEDRPAHLRYLQRSRPSPRTGAFVNNLYLLLALVTGAGVAVMAVFNARLGGLLGGPFWAAAAQFSVALSVVLSVAFLTRQPAPITTGIGGAPWWVWTGGVFSATFIVVSTS